MKIETSLNYVFHNPGFVNISQRTKEENAIVKTNSEVWSWKDLGKRHTIDWNKLNLRNNFLEVAKGFVFYRLSSVSSASAYRSNKFFKFLSKNKYDISFPWSDDIICEIISKIIIDRAQFLLLRTFYSWGLKSNINGFNDDVLLVLSETKAPEYKPYKNIFLNPSYLNSKDEILILNYITKTYNSEDYNSLLENVILHILFELAPRPSQLYCLDIVDLEKTSNSSMSEHYYSLNLTMTKKIKSSRPEKRIRKISSILGNKIERLISLNRTTFDDSNLALFKDINTGNRLSSVTISEIVVKQCSTLELSQKADATLFRHHLAQSLADQGASAETISEILGHNSTLPARAYIASTPSIGATKSKALGNNETYKELNAMFLTGEIIERRKAAKERWVNGMVGTQYIGGIGSCGLTENTACPKNPVYSCYTCSKFHPFIDGSHEKVKINLQKQAQFFVDIAEKGLDLEHNRPVIQLERTIEAVENVLNIIASNK